MDHPASPPAAPAVSTATAPGASACAPGGRSAGRSVSLPVAAGDGAGAKAGAKSARGTGKPRSTMGRWRAAVLIVIHLLIAAHVAQWLLSGMRDGVRETLSPVEPSESMFTLEGGHINAGFVMFALAIASTLILGRFFCGWACHVVALQDLCGWMMKKIGLHPRPWRTRLLLWTPLLLALYMFVWPTYRREFLVPEAQRLLSKEHAAAVVAWVGEPRPLVWADVQPAFMVEDFWATFPPWYIAVPFLLVCGFACVYFLGSKGFCSYGCPYGGFFGPADRLAPLRIRVSDACNGCGHCTAVCTSNVKVAQEVRDYGAVVDAGCMKCLDCISACPNDALRLGWGAPAIFAEPRPKARGITRHYDLSLREELVFAAVGFGIFWCFRGGYGDGWFPLLMAVGIAAVGTFLVSKAWRLLRDSNVRGPFRQLKLDGRLTPAGWVFAGGMVLLAALTVQAGTVKWNRLAGYTLDDAVDTPSATVFAAGYVPAPADASVAERAMTRLRRSMSVADGGLSFRTDPDVHVRLSWLSAVAGDLGAAERHAKAAALARSPASPLVEGLLRILALRRATPQEADAALRAILERHPRAEAAREALAKLRIAVGRVPDAVALYKAAADADPLHPPTVTRAARLLGETGDVAGAEALLKRALEVRDRSATLRDEYATLLFFSRRYDEAARELAIAIDREPTPDRLTRLADVLAILNRTAEAAAARARATDLQSTWDARRAGHGAAGQGTMGR